MGMLVNVLQQKHERHDANSRARKDLPETGEEV